VTSPDVQTRVFRSPSWMAGLVVAVMAVVGAVAFFVEVTWTEFAGTYGGYLNLAKVPLSAVIFSYWGLSVARSRVVSAGAETIDQTSTAGGSGFGATKRPENYL
jgi:hypothetical protein